MYYYEKLQNKFLIQLEFSQWILSFWKMKVNWMEKLQSGCNNINMQNTTILILVIYTLCKFIKTICNLNWNLCKLIWKMCYLI